MRALLIACVALSACSVQRGVVASPTASPAASPTAIPQTAAYRTECAATVLSSFIDAFDRADAARLAAFFSATDGVHHFEFFYTPETPPYGPDLSHLVETLVSWQAAGERWRLVSVTSGGGPSWHGGVDLAVAVERSWPDRSVTNDGKGALDCAARTIFAFAIGPR